ncbi:serine/threonine protein kinase, AGC family [Xylogone sp. PMI_703]|nr:serine/threonine protein kinase, AGC family [Xylogone sp. PMI_703]
MSRHSVITTGVLTVTLHEARGLTTILPDETQGYTLSSSDITKQRVLRAYLPYAVIDFDKSQIIDKAYLGTYDAPVWSYGGNPKPCFDVTRKTSLQIWLYQTVLKKDNTTTTPFLGTVIYQPSLKQGENISEEWLDLRGGTGAILITVQFVPNEGFRLSPENFGILWYLNTDKGKELLVRHTHVHRKKDNHRYYVMFRSRSPKAHRDRLVRWPVTAQIDNPFIATLKFNLEPSTARNRVVGVFVSTERLSAHLKNIHHFDIFETRLYAAQLVYALECLHRFDIAYGDLQMQDICVDYTGHILLINFDIFLQCLPDSNEAPTTEHIDSGHFHSQATSIPALKTADWWSLGTIICEMLTGCRSSIDNYEEVLQQIFDPTLNLHNDNNETVLLLRDAKELVTRLLDPDPLTRLGANGSSEIKAHPFFNGIDWAKLLRKEYVPCFRPRPLDPMANVDDTCRLGLEEK